ncbi:MAG: hypothetical protein IK078_09420 [Lachnospiraceae bacterium]|nr:hypothetical protein [Lachnospiraceae bacterium]
MIIKLADRIVGISSLFQYMELYCDDYVVKSGSDKVKPDFSIEITQADIDHERRKSEQKDIAEGISVRENSDAYLETLAVYRKIAEIMPSYDTILMHGSSIAVDGKGYLFTAKSGTGKSTHTRLWRELLGQRAVMINDDKPLIRVNDDGSAVVYGTPWDGKHRLSSSIAVPLKVICILERGKENSISEVVKEDVYPMLLQQIYRSSDRQVMEQTIKLIDRLDVKLFKLSCNMDPGAAMLSFNTMSQI